MKKLFLKNKKNFTSDACAPSLRSKTFFVVLAICAWLPSCNRGGLGGKGDTVSPTAQVDISLKMLEASSPTASGRGQLLIYASYPLVLNCINCSLLGINLPFSEGTLDGKQYKHVAEFNYSLVTQTEECALEISAVSKGSTKINARKKYKVYVCPRHGTTRACDTTNAVPSCAHIGR